MEIFEVVETSQRWPAAGGGGEDEGAGGGSGGERESKLVAIGRHLDSAALQAGLSAAADAAVAAALAT